MAKKIGNINEDDIKNLRADAIGLLNDLDAISNNIGNTLNKVSKLTGENVSAFKEGFNASKALADAISKVDSKTLASKKEQSRFQDKVRKAQEEALKLEAKASRLRAEAANLTKKQAVEAFKVARAYEDGAEKLREQASTAKVISDQFDKINSKAKIFDKVSDLAKDIPLLSKVFKEFQSASDASREAASEGAGRLKSFATGAKELGGVLVKGLGALGIGFLVKGLKDADERSVSLSRNLNMSKDSADKMLRSFNETARGIQGLTGKDLQQSVESFSESLGTTAIVSKDTAEELASQVKFLGLSVDEANKLAVLTEASSISAKDLGNQIRGEVKLSNALNKTAIDYKVITKDIANTSAAIKISTQGTGKSLAIAAIEAKKLGLSLSDVDKIADSLLNFEQSIASELEAELLTGRNLNLEQARLYALNNDIAGVAKEIAKQGITQEKFSRMNRIQQEAIAGVIGMSREELANSLMEQTALANLGAKTKEELSDKVKLELQRIDQLKQQGKIEEAEAARKKLIGQLGNDELVRQQENRTLAELQAESAQKMIEAFDALQPVLDVIKKLFEFINDHAKSIALILGGMAGLSIINSIMNLGKGLKGVLGIFKSIRSEAGGLSSGMNSGLKTMAQQVAAMKAANPGMTSKAALAAIRAGGGGVGKAAGKGLFKALGKSFLKKIPIIGAIAGLGFAASRALEGDWAGAGLEAASGIAGTLPGLGTAASIGLDATLAARDMAGPEFANGGIVTKKLKNATVGEAGTEAIIPLNSPRGKEILGGNSSSELAEIKNILNQILNKDTNVYMDSSKVGTALNLGSVRIQ